jgi:outer membrane protein assembly factor BamB
MNLSHRTLMVLAAGLLILPALGLDAARPAEDKAKEETADPLGLATDEAAGKKLQAATDYLKEEDWTNALRMLQFLLDAKTDGLTRLAGRDGKPDRHVSIHAEAERLIATMPPTGREAYQRIYGPAAAEAFENARASRDAEPLARIVERYLYTEAGPAALRELARLHYKAGRFHLAALGYARLLEHLGPARWTNDDLYQASVAFHRRGSARYADLALRQLLARSARNVVRLGERSLTAEQLRKEIERATLARQPLDWPIYRGDAARTNRGVGAAPFLEATWRKSLLYEEERAQNAQRLLREAEKKLHEQHEPIIPAFSPLAVTLGKGGQRIPALICKDYHGLRAMDARNGRLLWTSPSAWSLQRMLQGGTQKQNALTNWLNNYVEQSLYPQILFENSNVGTLSTDGEYVYFIEDLAVPPPYPSSWYRGIVLDDLYDKDTQDAIQHNRLYALDLTRTGALTWTLGDEEKGPLSECFFLAPPLPLDGLLYMLVEKKQQISLLCIDAHARDKSTRQVRPRIVSLTPLVHVNTALADDPMRRIHAAHLAYSDGILVCPTNAGVVLGVDLLSNRVAWVYPYPARDNPEPRFDRFGRPRHPKLGEEVRGRKIPNHTHWKAIAPVIADGKVVLVPPDDPTLYCLNLIDGSLAWSRPKERDDLYLAGVYHGTVLIVGTRTVRALSLDSGQTRWTVQTGLPSGQGIASNELYYLPLQKGMQSKQPEICVLDILKGRVIAHNKTSPRTPGGDDFEVPGNLLLVDGQLISQTAWEIVVYPSLKTTLDEANARVERKPDDPVCRIERAALRGNLGNVTGAIEDLQQALKNKPDKQSRRRARILLFDALSELFSRDLGDAERYLKEYKGLTEVDLEGLTGEKLTKERGEEHRRKLSYYLLVARLRESQGRLKEALQAYLDLGVDGLSEEQIVMPGEPALKVRVDVWVRRRIVELLKKAAPAQRKEVAEEMNRRLKVAQQGTDIRNLRTFVALIGPDTPAGREAALLFAKRLLASLRTADLLEAELHLLAVSRQRDDAPHAARALEMLGRFMTMRGLLPDAVHFYRMLRRDFGKTKLPDGQTGADVWDALTTDKRFLPYLAAPPPIAARYQARKESGDFALNAEVFPFHHLGEELPFFRSHVLGLDVARDKFHLMKRSNGEDVWTNHLTLSYFRSLLPPADARTSARLSFRTQGHLLVLPVDSKVFALDPMGRRILWEQDILAGTETAGPRAVSIETDPLDGTPLLIYPDGWVQHGGQNLLLSPSVLCLAARNALQAFDPLTGQLLWTRSDVSPRLRLFGDDEHVFLVEEDDAGVAVSTRVLRLADGATVPAPDFTKQFGQRVQVFGRTLVCTRRNDKDALLLQLYDMPTGVVVWEGTFAGKSIVLRSQEPRFAGVVEPDGKVHIVDVRIRKKVMSAKMTDHVESSRKVETIHLFADAERFYLACWGRDNVGGGRDWTDEAAKEMSDLGRRGVPVNGMLYAFERATGKEAWRIVVRNQRLVLDAFRQLPLLVLTTSSKAKRLDLLDELQGLPLTDVLCIQKRDGRVVYADKIKKIKPFFAVRADPHAGSVELVSPNLKITFQPYLRQPRNGK